VSGVSAEGRDLPAVSVILPAFNEREGIAAVASEISSVLAQTGIEHELIVVDDGSTDDTAEQAEKAGAEVLSLPENRGYGAAIQAGVAHSTHDTIAILDADGTYPAAVLPELLALTPSYDMVVGARVGKDVHIPSLRRPAKWFLKKLASYLTGRDIPDLNSGMRVLRRDLVDRFAHVLPSGFSFTTSITLAALCSGAMVRYHPIDYRPRIGESKIRPQHALDFFLLVLRSIVYFNPLRVFLPLGGFLFLGGLAKLTYDLFFHANVSDSAVLGFLSAGIVWAVGLLSDQIARAGGRMWMR
jgi:glycosyltransferase involved in cell wall biosynthesis